jgi:fimbrial isopeptide formation D2 family protein/LPXTG-motif cell wall-anchored protein
MKTRLFKKIMTGILSVAMVLSMGMTAFADDGTTGTGSITISNAYKGQEYSIYKVFDFDQVAGDNGVYKVSDAFKNFKDDSLFKVDANDYVTVNLANDADQTAKDTWAKAFAAEALSYAKANHVTATATQTAPKAATSATNKTTSIKFEGLSYGYYITDSTVGAALSLNTVNKDVTVEEKNDIPDITKQVQEDSTSTFGATNDAEIGQTVEYKSTISLKKSATQTDKYVMHDKMTDGLTFGKVESVTADGKILVEGTDYTVTAPATTDGDSFDLSLTKAYLQAVTADQSIVVSYNAVVNAKAVIGKPGNVNTVKLEYNNGVTTEDHSTTTYVYNFNLFKYAEGDDTKALADAHFSFFWNEGYSYDATKTAAANVTANSKNLVQFVVENGVYRVATPDEINNTSVTKVTDIVTTAEGAINIKGLDADTYHLIETQAPAGYNLLTKDVTVLITRDSDANGEWGVSKDGTKTADKQVKVENSTGALLPTTGGIGTTIFYVIGAILILGAAVALIVKRRASVKE